MIGRTQFVSLLICTLLLFGGCSSQRDDKKVKIPKDTVKTPSEKEKAKLLKQIARDFENPQAHFQLGQLYQAEGIWTQAEDQYNTAISFDPVHRESQAALVKVLIAGGDTAKAGVCAELYLNQVCASAEESLRLGLAFQKQGLDEYALGCYQQALRLAPNSASVNKQIGYYYLSKNDNVRAQDYLTRSFQLDPLQAEVAGELGRLGVAVKIPRKTQQNTKKLDSIVEKSGKAKTP